MKVHREKHAAKNGWQFNKGIIEENEINAWHRISEDASSNSSGETQVSDD